MAEPLLKLTGEVERPLELAFEDFLAVPERDQVRDVSRFHPSRKGDAVEFETILRSARPTALAKYLVLHADRDDFHVSISLEAVRSQAVLVYQLNGKPLGPENGGPIRFLIRDPAACHTDELDDCANVKYLSRLELAPARGQDTRPADEAAHEALHRKEHGE